MPVYEFSCPECGEVSERRRDMDDFYSELCYNPECFDRNGLVVLKKKFSAPAIIFRGSGFYRTSK